MYHSLINTLKTNILNISISVLGLLIITACVGGGANNLSPYQSATKLLATTSGTSNINPWVKSNEYYSFKRTNCLNGTVNTSDAASYCAFDLTNYPHLNYIIRNNYIEGWTTDKTFLAVKYPQYTTSPSPIKASVKLDDVIYVLNENGELFICQEEGNAPACYLANGKYKDMVAIDFDSNKCNNNATCIKDGKEYQSLLLLQDFKSMQQDNGSFHIAGNLVQLFKTKSNLPGGEKIADFSNETFITVKLSEIGNDIPIRPKIDMKTQISYPDINSYSFTLVHGDSFGISLTYARPNNKGDAVQYYFGSFKYGSQLIKQDVSKNSILTNPLLVERNRGNHLTVFIPTAPKVSFEGEASQQMKRDIRLVAGGNEDNGEVYKWCEGLDVVCSIGSYNGYKSIEDMNVMHDLINGVTFLASIFTLGAAERGVIEKMQSAARKGFLALRMTNKSGFKFVYNIFVAQGGLLYVSQLVGTEISKFYFNQFSVDPAKNLPYSTAVLLWLLNFEKDYGPKPCADVLYEKLASMEFKMRQDHFAISLQKENTVYDVFNNIKECHKQYIYNDRMLESIVSVSSYQKELMRSISIDSLSHYSADVIAAAHQKFFIDPPEKHESDVVEIETNGDISNFESDPQQPAADVSIRLPNCAPCDPTFFADGRGNYLTNSSGKLIETMNGHFVGVIYTRNDLSFQFPVLFRLIGQQVHYSMYAINAYQLTNLSCEQFNQQIAQITGNNTLAVHAALHNKDAWAVIVDRTGAACNYNFTDYKKMVYYYDPTMVQDWIMFLPLSTNPADAAVMLGMSLSISLIENNLMSLLTEAGARDVTAIRNGHLQTPYIPIQDGQQPQILCKNIPLMLRYPSEKLSQIAISNYNGALWVIGDQGLHYISEDKQFNFDFSKYGSGVASSHNGKLLITATQLNFQTWMERYDEKTLVDFIKNNTTTESNGYSVKLEQFREGSFAHSDGNHHRGVKLYVDASNRLYANYTDAIYAWDINSYSYLGEAVRYPAHETISPYPNDNPDSYFYEVNNLAFTTNGNIYFINQGLQSFQTGQPFNNSKLDVIAFAGDYTKNIESLANSNYKSQNPFVFALGDKIFTILDNGKIYQLDNKQGITYIDMPYYKTSEEGRDYYVAIANGITDVIGVSKDTFYLTTANKLFRCALNN